MFSKKKRAFFRHEIHCLHKNKNQQTKKSSLHSNVYKYENIPKNSDFNEH